MRFVDTNVLLYAISKAAKEGRKRDAALALLESEDVAVSVQVLEEFYVQATRPTRRDRLSHEQAAMLIQSWILRFPVQTKTVALVEAALATKQRFNISYWDAAIIEAARALGCEIVFSEDLAGGQLYGSVRVVNPFSPSS